jgi:hypothetical protein
MRFQGAVIREQGVEFALVVVRPTVLQSTEQATKTSLALRRAFPGLPVVLMAQDHAGRATFFGRQDITRFLAGVPLHAIPWRQYTLN